MALLPPKVYHPRAVCVLQVLWDERVGDAIPATFSAVPRSVTVERNSSRKADTASVELDYRDFPLDPRALSDVYLTVHIESSLDPLLPLVPSFLNRRFVGLVDEPRVILGADRQTVRLTARDFTGIYLDFKWGATPIPTPKGTTLSALVELIRAKVTPLTVPAVFTDPSTAAADVSARTGRATFTPEEDDSAWDVLSALCELFGLVPTWDLDILRVETPTESALGQVQMVYGHNVGRLEFHRSFKQPKNKQVKIVCWNPILGVPLEAVYPPTAAVTRLTEKGKPKPTVKQVQYNIEGPLTVEDLLELAKRVHTELAQGQLMGELETRDMTDLVGTGLLTLRNGNTLIVKLGPQDQASIASMSPAEAAVFLSNPSRPQALSPPVAQALATAWSVVQQLAVTFYVAEVVHEWDRDDGYRLLVRFREFILGV